MLLTPIINQFLTFTCQKPHDCNPDKKIHINKQTKHEEAKKWETF